jgi:hypothetical protein
MLASQKEMGKGGERFSPTPVLVRAAEGEPVRMEAVGIGPHYVTVRRPGGGETTVRFPYDIVYTFDDARYQQLVNAFTRGDRETLDRLWRVTPTLG